MISRHKILFILGISIFIMAISHISRAQSTSINSAYIATTSGDTIRNCEIKKSHRLTNENKVTYYYNDTVYSLPSKDVKSYFDGSQYFVSEKLNNKYILINYIIGGSASFGQSFTKGGEAIFHLKRNDTQEVVRLAEHKYNLLSFLKSFLPDFDAFYSNYNAKVYYDFKSMAELISAYNAFKMPDLFFPVKYNYKKNIKIGINASLSKWNLELIDDHLDFTDRNSFSLGLDIKQYYTRNVFFNVSLSYNNAGFIGTNEDLYIETVSLDPNLGFSTTINPRLEIAIKGGFNLSYNIDSYLRKKALGDVELEIVGFNFGPQLGIVITYLNRHSVFINYSNYAFKTNEESVILDMHNIEASANILQFGLIYYFASIYSK